MINTIQLYRRGIDMYVWYFLIAIVFYSAVQQISGQDIWMSISAISALFAYSYFSSNTNSSTNAGAWGRLGLMIFCILFVQTIFLSSMVVRSLMIFLSLLSAYYFYCTLSDFKHKKLGSQFNPFFATYLVLGLITAYHVFLLIVSYGLIPGRGTGLFKDYSQAALAILCTYALLYPLLKRKSICVGVTLLFFIAFFIPSSRTANFVLVIFLFLLFLYEKKQQDLTSFYKTFIIICLALACVLLYPELSGRNVDTTNAGGIQHYTNIEHYKNLNSRIEMWSSAWNAIKQNPLIGYGLGNYEWTGIKDVFPLTIVSQVHNDYLQVWLELGFIWFVLLIGFFAYVLIVRCPIHLNYKNEDFLKSKNYSESQFVAWCLVLCLSLYMCMNFILGSHFFQLIFAIVFAQLFSENRQKTTRAQKNEDC